jgi:hypothetical protein
VVRGRGVEKGFSDHMFRKRDGEKFLVNMLLGGEVMGCLFLCNECLGWKGGDEKFLLTTVGLHGCGSAVVC